MLQGILTLAMATLTLGMRMLLSVSKAFVIGFLTSEITSLISYGSLSQTSSSFTLWRFAWLLLTGYAAVLLWNMLNKVCESVNHQDHASCCDKLAVVAVYG